VEVVAVDAAGSGFMMLTAGMEDELGKSALVGLPVGTDAGASTSAAAAAAAGVEAAPHDAACRVTRPS